MDNSVVIGMGRGYKGLNGNDKKYNKQKENDFHKNVYPEQITIQIGG